MSSTLQAQVNPKIENAMVHAAYLEPPTVDDAGNVDGDWDERKTNKEGYVAFLNVNQGQHFLLVRAPGYEDTLASVMMPHDDLITIDLVPSGQPEPGPTALSRLQMDGLTFKDEYGRAVYLKGATFFPAYEIFLEFGPDPLRPALSELQSLGGNCVKVFCMSRYIQQYEFNRRPFDPRHYGDDYFNRLPEFCRFASGFGQYIYWSFGPDNRVIYEGDDQLQLVPTYSRWLNAIESEPNNLYQLTNEQNAHDFNRVDPTLFRMSNVPSCVSQFGDEFGGDVGPYPMRDFGDFEPRRDMVTKLIKDVCTLDHPITTKRGKGVIVSEPNRYGSNGHMDIREAVASAGASLKTAGWFFHSTNGKRCEPFDDQTLPIAKAVFRVLTSAV